MYSPSHLTDKISSCPGSSRSQEQQNTAQVQIRQRIPPSHTPPGHTVIASMCIDVPEQDNVVPNRATLKHQGTRKAAGKQTSHPQGKPHHTDTPMGTSIPTPVRFLSLGATSHWFQSPSCVLRQPQLYLAISSCPQGLLPPERLQSY